MLRSIRKMKGFTVAARDGEVGTIRDVLFDDRQWTVRFAVVDTGDWITDRQILISPVAFSALSWRDERVTLHLDRDAIERSPHVATGEPVTRRHEREHFEHYGWPFYWGGPNAWGTGLTPQELAVAARYPGVLPEVVAEASDGTRDANAGGADPAAGPGGMAGTDADEIRSPGDAEVRSDEHLRSSVELMASCLQGLDGPALNINDLLVDDERWRITYLSVGAGEWFTGDHVLLAPEWIDRADYEGRMLFTELTREEILQGPLWDPRAPAEREYERHLHTDAWGRPTPLDPGRDLAP